MGESAEVLAIVGPTAIGKTTIGIRVAKEINGEIISADARQIYRGMDIGTAKPTAEELAELPHHMIDSVDPGEYFSAGVYGEMGQEVIASIISRGKVPVIIGGSGLYFRALVDGLFKGDSRSDEVRERIAQEVNENGLQAVYERLIKIDGDYAELISSNDEIRITRALEVYELTGKSLSKTFLEQSDEPLHTTLIIGLRMERKILIERIEERVEEMIASGLVEEVQRLLDAGHREHMQKIPTIGYSEVMEFLDGNYDEAMMIAKIKTNSRRYAKRQMTWFKTDKRITWIDMDRVEDASEIVVSAWRANQNSD